MDKILDETEFDAQIALGRSQAAGLIPKALKGAEMAFEKGDGATSCRFLEGMGVLGEQDVSGHQPALPTTLMQQINLLYSPPTATTDGADQPAITIEPAVGVANESSD